MTDDVPPARQCAMPSCEDEATDPTAAHSLCPAHHPDYDDVEDGHRDDHAETDAGSDGATPRAEARKAGSSETVDGQNSGNSGESSGGRDMAGDDPLTPGESQDADGSSVRHTSGSQENGDSLINESGERDGSGARDPDKANDADEWADAEFAAPESGAYPRPHHDREQWMGRLAGEKMPFSPWADRDHPEADPDDDARYKWGLPANYTDDESVAMAEADSRLDGRVFIQRDDDPFAFVDGDDVRDPETGEVHPAFVAILEHLGLTYADVSTSGAGVHAYYQGELPIEGKGQAAFDIDTDPWGANDSPPTVEIYANKHVCVTTGEHIPNTPIEAREWDADALRAILEANGYTDEPEITHDTDRDRPDLDEHDPAATAASETTSDIRDILLAVDRLSVHDLTLRSRQTGTDSTGWETWDPSYRPSDSGASLHRPSDEPVFHDHKEGESFGILGLFAAEQGIISDPWSRLAGDDWWEAVEAARDDGAPIPEYESPTHTGEHHTVEACTPPATDRRAADIETVRDEFAGWRYDTVVEASAPVIWGDDPGTGKTTTAGIAAAQRDRPHAILFSGHEKAREFVLDDATPDGYYHLKGGEQKRDDVCMDADHADEQCPEHPSGQCPHMCPVYDLDGDHPTRQTFDALTKELGPVMAHILLAEELHETAGHDSDGKCPWFLELEAVEHEDRVVGVHEYQTLKTVRDGRDIIVDEHPGPDSVATERELSVEQLTRMANALDKIGEYTDEPLLGEFAEWSRDLIDAITGAGEGEELADLEPPAVGDYAVSIERSRGMPGEGYETEQRVDEALAQAKLAYHESLLSRIQSDKLEWNGAPFAFDALLAAAAEAGVDGGAIRRAIAAPSLLDNCPRCGHNLDNKEGERVCPECQWAESEAMLTGRDAAEQRATAWLGADETGRTTTLATRRLPLAGDLPTAPLILDATPAPEAVARLYGADPDAVELQGDDDLEAEQLHVTQVLDGQYHWNTIKQTDSLRDRIERALSQLADVHDDLLVIGRKAARQELEIPDGVEWLSYHAARGKNRAECDAVVCIGAPHPRVDDLQRDAQLLAQGTDDTRVGGVEHSTRQGSPNPPVYRQLEYEDDDGNGRAVPTKHYTGLTGELFRQTREQELEQAVHRIRPLLAGEMKHAYLLTNVPTRLPVDEVCSFEELTDPLQALLPVADGAIALAEQLRAVAAGEGPEGFRADALVERDDDGRLSYRVSELHRLARVHGLDVSERTVRRWVEDLVDVGLLDAGEYKPREGVPYQTDAATLTQALSVLHSNAGVEVAAQRRLRRLITESSSALEWLEAAREALGLCGDRRDLRDAAGGPVPPG